MSSFHMIQNHQMSKDNLEISNHFDCHKISQQGQNAAARCFPEIPNMHRIKWLCTILYSCDRYDLKMAEMVVFSKTSSHSKDGSTSIYMTGVAVIDFQLYCHFSYGYIARDRHLVVIWCQKM